MKDIMRLLVTMLIVAILLVGCGSQNSNEITKSITVHTNNVDGKNAQQNQTETQETEVAKDQSEPVLKDDRATNKSNSEYANQLNEKVEQLKIQSNKPTATQAAQQETSMSTPINEAIISINADAETGVILKATSVSIEEDDTVLELLKKVTKQNRIQMEYSGSGATAYIEGIQNLYEFDKGPKSGWMFSVNGVFMKKGAGTTEIHPGDKIEWAYTLDLGKDLGATLNE